MTPEERGDLAERLLPVAAKLVCIVHGDGGPRDIHQAVARLTSDERDALLVVMAGLVDPDAPVDDVLGYVTWDEHGNPAPAVQQRGTIRGLVDNASWPSCGIDNLLMAELKQKARVLTARGYGHREIADQIGVNERTVSRWKAAGRWWAPVEVTEADVRPYRRRKRVAA